MRNARVQWPTDRMAVPRIQDESPLFWRGLVLGLAISAGLWGLIFAAWAHFFR